MNINVGVLVPHSKTYPTMSKEYINGLKLGAKSSSISYSYTIEGIGAGADSKVILDKAQKFAIQDDVHVITGLMGHIGIEELQDYVKSMEIVLLYSDLGATLPKTNSNNSWSFCNSFELYKSAMLFGEYAPKWGCKNIAISSSYYDSGYGLINAIEKTLYKSGGEFSGHFITPLHPRENESALMSQFITEVKPDAVFAIHSGIYANEHAEFLAENKIQEKLPLYSSPFGLDTHIIRTNEDEFVGSKCISSWCIEEERKSNQDFIKLYQMEYGKLPTVFAMLGYENGLVLNTAVQALEDEDLYLHELKNKLSQVSIEGPRGGVNFLSQSNRTAFKHYLWEVIKDKSAYKKEKKLEIDLELEKPIFNESDEQVGGWQNAYLCN